MKIILLERVPSLGQMGDEVNVKNGYARNFLLPNGKALRATEASRKEFANRKHEIEAHNLERHNEAQAVCDKLEGQIVTAIRQAGESGYLYGSVTTRDIVALLAEQGFTIVRTQIKLSQPIKMVGLHKVTIALFGDIATEITVNVARSEDEAERQVAGEILTGRKEEDEYDYSNLGAILREDEGDDEDDAAKASEDNSAPEAAKSDTPSSEGDEQA